MSSHSLAPISRVVLSGLLSVLLVGSLACRDAGGGSSEADPDAGTSGPVQVEACDNEIPDVTDGTCQVTPGTGSAVLMYGDVIGVSTIYGDGMVMYEGTQITCVGCDCRDTAGFAEATVVHCPGAAISPGLINPHDHITFAEAAPLSASPKRYDQRNEWRDSLRTPGNKHAEDGPRWGELRMLMSGVTSMAGAGEADNMVRNLDRVSSKDRSLGFAKVNYDTFPLQDNENGTNNRPDCNWNYKNTEAKVAGMAAYIPHIGEGINEYAATEFRCQSSSFGKAQDFTESNVSHIHSIGLSAVDYFNMARDGARIVWSPRSNISLYGMTAQAQIFHRLGGILALGTDWTYSGSANMQRELACADSYNRNHLDQYFSDRQLFDMATINAATATASEALIGSLEVGKLADIAVYGGDKRYFRAIIDGANKDVALVVSAGDALLGDAAVMSGLGKSCDSLDMCGTAKAICATQEFGKDYDALKTAVSGAYPAFFCGEPSGEPTCLPSRPGEYTGVLSADDSDGDGFNNDNDNCPTVFNPIRPIDKGVQPDLDGDGIGDACDDSPLPADIDDDGKDNLVDNCPFDANPDQADGDGDDKGDVCDFCPAVSNPMSVCSELPGEAATIAQVQDGSIAEGSNVLINDVVVTAIYDRGLWVQDPLNTGTHSGVHVFTGSTTGRAIGDLVDVTGTVKEFFTDTELKGATVTFKSKTTPIEPVLVTVAQAITEPYESMLVTISDAAMVVNPYDCALDEADCTDPNLWQVNGSLVVYDRAYVGADWAAKAGQLGITGVMTYRRGSRRIQPRSGADLVTP